MERVVSVNGKGVCRGDSVRQGFDPHPTTVEWPEAGDWRGEEIKAGRATASPATGWQEIPGNCFYLGRAGERCNRPAVAGGFCSRHQPGGLPKSATANLPAKPSRILAAILAFLGILWPLVSPLVHAMVRWIHRH
jgi:hypothetical protein